MNEMSNPAKIRQRGIVLPIVAIAMTVLIGMAGLALDLAHAYLDKARLQTAVDAAALAGAKVLNELGDPTPAQLAAFQQQAADAAVTAFNFHLEGDLTNAVPIITFSTTLAGPFGALPVPDAGYVRAAVTGLPSPVLLARVLPGVADTLAIDASAVAGPTPPIDTNREVCDLAPLLACGPDPNAEYYGLVPYEEYCLKYGSPPNVSPECETKRPGNFGLIELDCPGGDCARESLADSGGCAAIGDTVPTKTGNTVGPTYQGYMTRFNVYHGAGMNPIDYPPDTITTSPLRYAEPGGYLDRQADGNIDVAPVDEGGYGVPGRRILAVPIGPPCDESWQGKTEVQVVGIGCFYMTAKTSINGQQEIFGEFIEECEGSGDFTENPGGPGTGQGPDLDRVILYNDMASADS